MFRLNLGIGPSPLILGVAPVISDITSLISHTAQRLHQGQTLSDMSRYPDYTAVSSYRPSTDGTITVITVVVDLMREGSPFTGAKADTELQEGDVFNLSFDVEDSNGNSATFTVPEGTVEYAIRGSIDAANNTVVLDRNPIATSGVFPLDFTGSDTPYNGIYAIDLAEYITRPVILATAPVTGTVEVDEILTSIPGLAASEGTNGIESRAYQWYRFLTYSEDLSDRVVITGANSEAYTITSADEGYSLVRGETVTDSLGASQEAFTAASEVPGGVVAGPTIQDTFTGPDGTVLTARAADTGQSWASVGGDGVVLPVIDGNRIMANKSNGGSEYLAIQGADFENGFVEADINTASFGSGLGLIIRSQGTGSARVGYYARINRSSNALQLYRQSPGTALIGSFDMGSVPNNTVYRVRLEANGDQIQVFLDGVLRIGPVANTMVTGTGAAGIGHYRGNQMKIDNFSAGEF